MFMDALLGRSSVVRTVAVTFEPIPTDAPRGGGGAVTRDRADRELGTASASPRPPARSGPGGDARREAELAAGHCEVRLSGFVTVAAAIARTCALLLRGPGARGAGTAGAAPDVRPAGRRVHVSRCRSAEGWE